MRGAGTLRARERRIAERGRLSLMQTQSRGLGARSPATPQRLPTSADDLLEMLSTLPEPQQQAMTMRYVLGYSLAETAEALACPSNTVRSRIRLAREALRSMIAATPSYVREALLAAAKEGA